MVRRTKDHLNRTRLLELLSFERLHDLSVDARVTLLVTKLSRYTFYSQITRYTVLRVYVFYIIILRFIIRSTI